jgi:hypothetical protein
MLSHDYVFQTVWTLRATIDEVTAVLFDPESLPRWWPSVYIDVRVLERGDEKTGLGQVVSLYTKGWLPYTLRWSFRVVESDLPSRLAISAFGDLTGSGVWTFSTIGDFTRVTYDWRIRADKPLLKYGSPLMKRVFQANHEWAMARGLDSLKLEIARRRGNDLPPPPARTFDWMTPKT